MGPAEQEQPVVYRFGKFILDARERALLADGKPIHLTNKVFDTLLLLVRHNGRLLTKDEMMTAVWEDSYVEESNLTKNISRLRKILNTSDTQLIETLPKKGYRFLAEVEEMDGEGTLLLNRNLRVKITQTQKFEPGEIEQYEEQKIVPALPASRTSRRWPMAAVGILVLVLVVLGFYLWKRRPAIQAASGPQRLTNNQNNEEVAMWTPDNRIRFARFMTRTSAESLVMHADGSGEEPGNRVIKNFSGGNWSRDGSKVLFSKTGEKPVASYIANVDGTNEVKLSFVPGSTDWSPDGSLIVFNMNAPGTSDSEIYTYGVYDGKLTNISNSPTFEANPAFSPDGKKIVFNSQRDGRPSINIFTMNVDGSDVRRLTDDPTGEVFPVFTPDGTQILFDSIRENERVGIYLMNVDSNAPPVKLSDTKYNAETRRSPFSPDGTRIVVMSDMHGDNFNIYTMSAEALKPTLLVESSDRDLSALALSPDGKKLAYQARLTDKSGELCVFDIERGRSRTLVQSPEAELFPAWSPTGDRLAYRCKNEGTSDICTTGADGGDVRNLTANPARDTAPVWAGSGDEIIFASTQDGGDALKLFRINADGSGLRGVTGKYGYEMTPALSPDGRMIAFAGDRQDGRSRALDIFLMDLADPANERILAVLPDHDGQPAFSPDGARLAFVSNADGNQEIYLVNTDGTGLVRLTRSPADDNSPQFSRDGKQILFSSNRGGRFAIYSADIPF